MNYLGFMSSGGLILLYVLTFRTRFRRTAVTAIGTGFLALFAVGVILAGVFSCDTGCPTAGGSFEQKVHDLVSLAAFPSLLLGISAWGCHFLRLAGWKRFGLYSLASAGVSVVLLVAMIQSVTSRIGTGAYQRLFLGILFLWLVMLAIRLARSGR